MREWQYSFQAVLFISPLSPFSGHPNVHQTSRGRKIVSVDSCLLRVKAFSGEGCETQSHIAVP